MVTPPTPSNNSPQSQSNEDSKIDKNKDRIPPFNWKKAIENEEEDVKDSIDQGKKKPSPMTLAAESKKKEQQKSEEQESAGNLSQSLTQFEMQTQQRSERVGEVSKMAGVNTELVEVAKQVSEMIHSMNVTTVDQETITSVSIHTNGIFNNALINVHTIGGEHNLIFTNLTQKAQEVLENRVNQSHLRDALHQNGIVVHNIQTERNDQLTSSTQAEHSDDDQRDKNEDQHGGGQGKNPRN